jgi:hypothetical protein
LSAVETPPPSTPVERRCPRCGARLSAEQEWCVECGFAVGTRVAAPRGWRWPLALVTGLLALALIALILALVELAGPAEHVTEVAATPTPPASAPTATPPAAAPTPSPSPTPAPATQNLATWPQGRTAWTVILNSSGTRADAERLAGDLAGKGIPGVGVLDSNDFESLGPDSFVIFSGQYQTRQQAADALTTIRDRAGGGSPRRIVPKKRR